MTANTSVISVVMLVCVLFIPSTMLADDSGPSEKETRECNQELKRIRDMDASFTPGPTNNLERYVKVADAIQDNWSHRNKVCYARLMSAVCGPLSSGRFKNGRQYEVARKYALSALENRDAIPLNLELELTGHVITLTIGPNAPKEKDFAECRRKDVEVRLHAWKRLADALDVNWNRNERLRSPNAAAAEMGFAGAISPEDIKDVALRAKYEAAIRENSRKIETYTQQQKLRLWLKTFPKSAERYIVQAYSHPPCDVEELRKSLNEYKVDENAKARILNAVTKNCAIETKEKR